MKYTITQEQIETIVDALIDAAVNQRLALESNQLSECCKKYCAEGEKKADNARQIIRRLPIIWD